MLHILAGPSNYANFKVLRSVYVGLRCRVAVTNGKRSEVDRALPSCKYTSVPRAAPVIMDVLLLLTLNTYVPLLLQIAGSKGTSYCAGLQGANVPKVFAYWN